MKGKDRAQQPRKEEPTEFELVKESQARFNASAWRASVEGRRRMPRYTATALDPGLVRFTQEKRSAAFLSDMGSKAEVRPAKAPDDSLGFVAAAEVVSRQTFHPGTLLIPLKNSHRTVIECNGDITPATRAGYFRIAHNSRRTSFFYADKRLRGRRSVIGFFLDGNGSSACTA